LTIYTVSLDSLRSDNSDDSDSDTDKDIVGRCRKAGIVCCEVFSEEFQPSVVM